MRSIVKIFSLIAFSGWSSLAAADLYRWVDPETGSVKFSSYPPPWYGDPAQERRSPRVEHMPTMETAPAAAPKVEPKAAPASELATLQARLRSLLQELSALPANVDFNRAGTGLKQQLDAYQAVAGELDRMDPKGAERRRAEAQPLIEKLLAGLRAQFSTKPPAAPVRER